LNHQEANLAKQKQLFLSQNVSIIYKIVHRFPFQNNVETLLSIPPLFSYKM
jgi:hypothetical protein